MPAKHALTAAQSNASVLKRQKLKNKRKGKIKLQKALEEKSLLQVANLNQKTREEIREIVDNFSIEFDKLPQTIDGVDLGIKGIIQEVETTISNRPGVDAFYSAFKIYFINIINI